MGFRGLTTDLTDNPSDFRQAPPGILMIGEAKFRFQAVSFAKAMQSYRPKSKP
jgi:hypothetical protein